VLVRHRRSVAGEKPSIGGRTFGLGIFGEETSTTLGRSPRGALKPRRERQRRRRQARVSLPAQVAFRKPSPRSGFGAGYFDCNLRGEEGRHSNRKPRGLPIEGDGNGKRLPPRCCLSILGLLPTGRIVQRWPTPKMFSGRRGLSHRISSDQVLPLGFVHARGGRGGTGVFEGKFARAKRPSWARVPGVAGLAQTEDDAAGDSPQVPRAGDFATLGEAPSRGARPSRRVFGIEFRRGRRRDDRRVDIS